MYSLTSICAQFKIEGLNCLVSLVGTIYRKSDTNYCQLGSALLLHFFPSHRLRQDLLYLSSLIYGPQLWLHVELSLNTIMNPKLRTISSTLVREFM